MKVLVADDNPMWRGLLERNVTAWEYEVVLAEDGNQAWDVLQRDDAPRIAILDWEMPGMDGIEVLGRYHRLLSQAK